MKESLTDNEKIQLLVEYTIAVTRSAHSGRETEKEKKLHKKLLRELLGRTPTDKELVQGF